MEHCVVHCGGYKEEEDTLPDGRKLESHNVDKAYTY